MQLYICSLALIPRKEIFCQLDAAAKANISPSTRKEVVTFKSVHLKKTNPLSQY